MNCLLAYPIDVGHGNAILVGPVEQTDGQKGNKRFSKECNKCSNELNSRNAKSPLGAMHSLPSKNKELSTTASRSPVASTYIHQFHLFLAA